jgi:hypothetical protein
MKNDWRPKRDEEQVSSGRRDILRIASFAAAAAVTGSASKPKAQQSPTPTLQMEGNSVTIPDPQTASELNQELQQPENFRAFADDPSAFAAQRGLEIDPGFANQLRDQLRGVPDLTHAHEKAATGDYVTAWAIAEGSYSIASSKVAAVY